MEALLRKGLDHDYFLWMDDNLSLYYPWQYLSRTELDFMRSYANFGRVGCFKGYSPQTFQENTRARPEMLGRQIDILRKWTREGIDTYGYITLTTSSLDGMRNSLREFMDAIQSKIAHSFLLRIIPLEIREYTPTLKRMNSVHMKAIENQYSGLANWLDELDDRYSSKERGTPIYEIPCSD